MQLPQERQIAALLSKADIPPDKFQLHSLSGGANNRVFRLATISGNFLLKIYFRHPNDKRDRLHAEFEFCRYAWDNGLRWIPQPLAEDKKSGMGLYEFIHGDRIKPTAIPSTQAIKDVLAFYQALNHDPSPAAYGLPDASEACFSLDCHLKCVNRRVQRLLQIESNDEVAEKARNFCTTQLIPLWENIRAATTAETLKQKIPMNVQLPKSARCLSPSDFGFHNALLTPGGSLRFIDFEYAGWDDPAKTVCDFFCQPAVPVPSTFFTEFRDQVATCHTAPEMCKQRVKLLWPVYQIKWCCIMLNVFLPVDNARRKFAKRALDTASHRRHQLQMAMKQADKLLEPSATT